MKSPKLYFTDTGLLAHLLRYQSSETLLAGPLSGNFFENFLVMEVLKKRSNEEENFELHFYRDSNKNEIDLVIETGEGVRLIEIKVSKTVKERFFKPLGKLLPLFNNPQCALASFDDKGISPTRDAVSLHWADFLSAL